MEDLTKTKDHESYHAIRESKVGLFPEPSGRARMAGRVTRQNRQTINVRREGDG